MRRLFVVMGIFVGAVLLAFLAMGVFLMLAPGTKLFGVQYVKAEKTSSMEITKKYEDILMGDIIIETYGVPVTVEYSSNGSFEFSFVQKFNGFTKSNIERPSLSVSKNNDGNLVVKTTEFAKFLWGTNNSGYSLKCKIPGAYLNKGLIVKSTKSTLTLTSGEYAAGTLSTADLSTNGAVKLTGDFTIGTLKITGAKNAITIPETYTVANVNIAVGSKPTTIKSEISGKLTHSSKSGSLTFVSCGELDATTKSGKIESTSNETSVVGNAKITTKSGKIVLQHVGGDLTATTKSGKVYIGSNLNSTKAGVNGKVTITTTKGSVNLLGTFAETEQAAKITTTSGKVTIGDNSRTEEEKAAGALAIISKATISTSSGQVIIEKIDQAKVTTKSGKITIGNFAKADITTSTGEINVTAGYVQSNLKISAAKKANVKATNLTGTTKISTKGSVYAGFKTVLGRVEIAGESKAVTVVLPNDVTAENHNFWITSEKTSATVHVADVSKNAKIFHTISEILDDDDKLIKVTSVGGKITVISRQYE